MVGPNGSGKSNFIEAIALLQATPGDLQNTFRRGGGFTEWAWKGDPSGAVKFDFVIENQNGKLPLRHKLELQKHNQSYRISDERVEDDSAAIGQTRPDIYYGYVNGLPTIVSQRDHSSQQMNADFLRSVFALRKAPEFYPDISYLAGEYEKIRIYREGTFGRNFILREPQKTDMRSDRLEKGFCKLLQNCGFAGRMPRLFACGGREATFDDFKTALAAAAPGDFVAMLIDSEDPITSP